MERSDRAKINITENLCMARCVNDFCGSFTVYVIARIWFDSFKVCLELSIE